ncbi:MAG TPA: ankyrin repeat domain-containing protein [Rhodocyclaceae bacterium]|nr:ankyrin repeat domain-containing protein [Rhodocyclaceae bacterium]HNH34426.1 ankyrin repeat domain-containing protein [Rhodocyclaceae bacterium]
MAEYTTSPRSGTRDRGCARGTGYRRHPLCRRLLLLALTGSLLVAVGCGEDKPGKATPADSASQPKAPEAVRCFLPVGDLGANEAAIFAAAAAGDLGRLERANEDGGKLDATDALKRTAVFAAASCNRSQALAQLLARGLDANTRDAVGLTPLHVAVIMGSGDAVTTLADKGAKLDARTPGGRTPLHLAAATGQADIVRNLLARGANAGATDRDGNSPGQLASRNGHSAVANLLQKARGTPRPGPQR